MNLKERLNVLIQATTLSQKNGALTLDDAVKAKNAIDVILSGVLNQNFTSAINTIIEIVVSSQKKGVYTLKDAYMIYIAVEGIEQELNTEASRELSYKDDESVKNNEETVIKIPPKKLNKNT